MPTAGFDRLLSQWYKNSYFHSSSTVHNTDPTFDRYNPAASLPKTDEKFSWSNELYLPLRPYLCVVQRTSKLLGFLLLRLIVSFLFWVYYLFNGTYLELRRSRRREHYARSARVLDVLGRHKYDTLVNLNVVSNFILRHREFDHPNRVLSDEASLYCVNSTEAVFIETDPGVEVWRGKYNSFHGIAQLQMAVRVIILPIASFYRLADDMGDPSGRLVFITNTARCGSTLLSRIYEKTDDFVSLSEPTGINCLREFVGREGDPWVQYHARSIIRMLCKATHVNNYAVKITPNSTKIVPLLKLLFPEASFVFIYRDPLPVCKSMYRIMKEVPMGRLNIIMGTFIPWLYLPSMHFLDYYDRFEFTEKIKIIPGYGQGIMLWANVINMYRRFRASGIQIAAIKYEDLVKDKDYALTRLFQYNQVSTDYVPLAIRAFQDDSQANSLLSQNTLAKTRLPPFTDEMRREVNKVCAHYRLPPVTDECVLEGTITRPGGTVEGSPIDPSPIPGPSQL